MTASESVVWSGSELVSPVWRETIYKLPGCWQICIHSLPGRNQLHMVNHTAKICF